MWVRCLDGELMESRLERRGEGERMREGLDVVVWGDRKGFHAKS